MIGESHKQIKCETMSNISYMTSSRKSRVFIENEPGNKQIKDRYYLIFVVKLSKISWNLKLILKLLYYFDTPYPPRKEGTHNMYS